MRCYSNTMGLRLIAFCVLLFSPFTIAKSFEEDLTLSLEQKAILDKFKNVVGPRLPHEFMREDVYLMRWLRAKDWNLAEAENFLMKHLVWREENNIDGIHKEDWSDLERDFQYHLESRDKEGRPLLYINAGDIDLRKSFLSGNGERFSRYVDKGLDEACTLVRELGNKYKNVSQGALMLNLEGFNLIQHGCLRCVPVLLRIVLSYESHHPGCAEKILLVNTPRIFEPVLNAARPIMSKQTDEALIILGSNKQQLQRTLLNYYEKDQLPPELGGTKIYKGADTDY